MSTRAPTTAAPDVLDAIPLAIIVLDYDGRVASWNRGAERLTGWTADEAMGSAAPFIPEEGRESFLARHRDCFESTAPVVLPGITVRRVRKDGASFECRVTRAVVRNAEGLATGVLGVLEDVTEKLRDEAAQLRAQANLRALIEHAPDAIVVHRLGFVLYANPSMSRLLGYSSDEDLVGRSVMSFVHPDYHDAVRIRIEALALHERTPALEQRFIRRDGSELHVEVVGIAILFDGEAAGLAHVRDLTERKRLEAQLRTSDRLASVGRLAAAVGHEINNPLAYVIANLATIAERVDAMAPPVETRELGALVADVREGAERVRRIVRDLKVFSQPAGDERAVVDVHRVLESCANMAGNEIRHRARLVKRYGAGVPLVLGSDARLGQVFLNLLVNAAQAIGQDAAGPGEVSVETRAAPSGLEVEVVVRDTGVGIAPELLTHVFDPFFTTKPFGQGTGLGLSISHSLVTSMGGTIRVESAVGAGTCVHVTLAAAPPGSRARMTTTPPARPTKARRRVLVVDDDVRVARAVERMLEGHDVVVATSGRAAIDAVRAQPPFDVVLCDLMMPELGGEDVYDALRTMRPGAERVIVFMSGGAFTARATAFLASVPNQCLEKPFQLDELLRAVEEER